MGDAFSVPFILSWFRVNTSSALFKLLMRIRQHPAREKKQISIFIFVLDRVVAVVSSTTLIYSAR